MITFIMKLPHKSLSRNCRFGITRLNCRVRNYANTPPAAPLCPPPKPRKDASMGTKYTIGALTIVAVGTIGYAKYDPDFRKWMGENVPLADGFFKVIFEEERTYGESFTALTHSLTRMMESEEKVKIHPPLEDKEKSYTPPRAVFPEIAKDKEVKEEKFNEIRVQKDRQTVDVVTEKPKTTDSTTSFSAKSVAELEQKIGEIACAAILAYHKAETALKDHARDIEVIVEHSVERLEPSIWTSLKKKSERKNEILKEADTNVVQVKKDLEIFRGLLDDPSLDAPEGARARAKRNIDRVYEDIQKAKDLCDEQRRLVDVTEKYWKKVENARCHFIEELEILFPDIDISNHKLSLKPSDVDLFLVHVLSHVLFYQKELHRVEILGQAKLKAALDLAKKGDPDFSIVETAIHEGIEKEKRLLTDEFQRKCLSLRKESERELRHRLKCQEQAHLDHLTDALTIREQELEREFHRKLDDTVAAEQAKNKLQMAGMIARMKGMRNAITERMEADKIAQQSQVLWSACQALYRAVKSSEPGVPWPEQIRPLESEVAAIKQAAAKSDELVSTVLAGIPREAIERGVYPEGAIRERFLKVERIARRVALVPEDGGRLALYVLSFVQSMLLITSANPIPQAELADEHTDFAKLDTYDILQRARYWIDRGNFLQTLKYMNLLKGASRCVANDWIQETRILLETQQAAETLMAHAVAGGLLHL